MIHSFTITNYLGEEIKLELKKPLDSGFLVRSVSGLEPVKASINTTEIATNDGALYNSARLGQRNIIFDIVFYDNVDKDSIEDVRHKSYKYFPLKKPLEILIETDSRCAKTVGYVESNEPNIFSSQESTQISVICPDPYFYSAGENGKQVTDISRSTPLFEFPFSNESLSEQLIEFGSVNEKTECLIDYQGDAEIGIIIHIYARGYAQNVTIHNTITQERLTLNTDKLPIHIYNDGASAERLIIPNDEIIINTVKGEKSITLHRNGVEYNILNCLDKETSWFKLTKGNNTFAFTAEQGIENLDFKIENDIIYEGV